MKNLIVGKKVAFFSTVSLICFVIAFTSFMPRRIQGFPFLSATRYDAAIHTILDLGTAQIKGIR